MDGPSLHSLGSSYYPPLSTKLDNPDRGLKSDRRLLKPEIGIRFLLSIPSSVPSTHISQERPVITDKVVTYLDGPSAICLLTSNSHLRGFSLAHPLYALLLKRDFPALYRPLATMVSKQPQNQGLLWQHLYALSHGPEPQVLRVKSESTHSLIQLADGRLASGYAGGMIRIWPLDGSPPIILEGHIALPSCLLQLVDGRLASGGSWDHTIRIWPLNGSEPIVLKGHTGYINCLVQLVDGRLASGSTDSTVRIWPLDGSPATILKGYTNRNNRLLIPPDSVESLTQLVDGRLVTRSSDGTMQIWPLDGSPPTVLTRHTAQASCLTQLTDGRIATGCFDGAVRIWSLDGSPPTVLNGPIDREGVCCLTQLMDGRLAAGYAGGMIRILPLDGSPPTLLTGHTDDVCHLVQLTDGRLASGSGWLDCNNLRIWPLDGSAPTLLKPEGQVDCLAKLEDGRVALGGAYHDTIRIWGKDPARLFQRALLQKTIVTKVQDTTKPLESSGNPYDEDDSDENDCRVS